MWTWLLNPWMLGLGAAAMSVPIIIHLLNRRRFKIVDWGAMDFLLQADKKNRRRVHLENFILLALRCLAMLLVGLFLARPFLPSSVAQIVQTNQKFERIFLLDDSLSTQVLSGDLTAIELAKTCLSRMATAFSGSNLTEDWLTVILTGSPEQPLLANEPVTLETLPRLLDTIGKVVATDLRADYSRSFRELSRVMEGGPDNVSRVLYVLSDLRKIDWTVSSTTSETTPPNEMLNELAAQTVGCYLVDIGGVHDQNIAITRFRPMDLQVANRVVRFAADVQNFGDTTINGLRVVFQVEEAPPQYQVVPSLLPGQSQQVVFPYIFLRETTSSFLELDREPDQSSFVNYRTVAEIDRPSMPASDLAADQLLADSTACCAARILDGIPVLLVDGDPSSISERSETHYLNSLNVLGTGLKTEVITATELETISLSNYQVIFLCNVDEASADRIQTLKNWIRDGGNLVLMPGNKVRAKTFNDVFHEGGAGLSPVQLVGIAGDPTMNHWVNFEVDTMVHPALRVVVDSDQTSLSRVDIFSWWTSTCDPAELGRSFIVPLKLTDDQNSPAMVERSWGQGRVVVFTIPADGDWSMWPSSPTYAPVMLDLIDYLVGAIGESANVRIGSAISYPVDLTVYDSRIVLRNPQGERVESVARPIGLESDLRNQQQEDVLGRVVFNTIDRRGFYELGLQRHSGERDTVLFAANIDPQEGALSRLEASELDGNLFSNKIRRVTAAELKDEAISGGSTEIWPQIVVVLIGILATEQFLGWWFGRKR